MEKKKQFKNVQFSAPTIKRALALFPLVPKDYFLEILSVETEYEEWQFDNEFEFYSAYRNKHSASHFWRSTHKKQFKMSYYRNSGTTIVVAAPERKEIEKVFEIFEDENSLQRLD